MQDTELYPMFRDYSLNELEQRTAYSVFTLTLIRAGKRKPSDDFKRKCARLLGKSQLDLFGVKAL